MMFTITYPRCFLFLFFSDPEVHTPCQSLVDYGNAQITRILISAKQQKTLSMSANIWQLGRVPVVSTVTELVHNNEYHNCVFVVRVVNCVYM